MFGHRTCDWMLNLKVWWKKINKETDFFVDPDLDVYAYMYVCMEICMLTISVCQLYCATSDSPHLRQNLVSTGSWL